MRELFIYYRLRSPDAQAARRVVQQFQSQLRRRYPHLQSRLLHRPRDSNGIETWMETYSTDPACEPGGVTVEVQSDIEAHALVLTPLLAGTRHTEVFIACVS
jgi:hypothetical protein